uniref:F-box domain-containing protein n=1 Tax=Erythrolobus madagascarensis TaxID=708628 RepID=A0A7S0T8B3_9RHOD|mmetsp:Transcript_1885/g.4132  ORF Transcript_1885/g.4132 Transcript_1885/m.4132 type:complete len:577 (+) Transcript_1885:110-1840(+)
MAKSAEVQTNITLEILLELTDVAVCVCSTLNPCDLDALCSSSRRLRAALSQSPAIDELWAHFPQCPSSPETTKHATLRPSLRAPSSYISGPLSTSSHGFSRPNRELYVQMHMLASRDIKYELTTLNEPQSTGSIVVCAARMLLFYVSTPHQSPSRCETRQERVHVLCIRLRPSRSQSDAETEHVWSKRISVSRCRNSEETCSSVQLTLCGERLLVASVISCGCSPQLLIALNACDGSTEEEHIVSGAVESWWIGQAFGESSTTSAVLEATHDSVVFATGSWVVRWTPSVAFERVVPLEQLVPVDNDDHLYEQKPALRLVRTTCSKSGRVVIAGVLLVHRTPTDSDDVSVDAHTFRARTEFASEYESVKTDRAFSFELSAQSHLIDAVFHSTHTSCSRPPTSLVFRTSHVEDDDNDSTGGGGLVLDAHIVTPSASCPRRVVRLAKGLSTCADLELSAHGEVLFYRVQPGEHPSTIRRRSSARVEALDSESSWSDWNAELKFMRSQGEALDVALMSVDGNMIVTAARRTGTVLFFKTTSAECIRVVKANLQLRHVFLMRDFVVLVSVSGSILLAKPTD